jgi:hypothetical protein
MSRELYVDVLPVEGSRDTYKVILLGYRGGAPPRIDRIAAQDFFRRLQSVLLWPEETIGRLRESLSRTGRLANERLESPTERQLQGLGFDYLRS